MNAHQVTHGGLRWAVIHGDSRGALSEIAPRSCDLLLTDPPYAISEDEPAELTRRGGTAIRRDFGEWDRSPEEIRELIREVVQTSARLVHELGAAYVFTSGELFGDVRAVLQEAFGGRLGTLVWAKTNPAPSVRKAGWLSAVELCCWARRPGNAFDYPGHRESYNWIPAPLVHHAHRSHPTEKSVEVLMRIIAAQTRPGDLVLDPFCGTGSTGEAALRLGRRFIGVELDQRYVEHARRRLRAAELQGEGTR